MQKISILDIVENGISRISPDNNWVWEDLISIAESCKGENIEFDFEDVYLQTPWNNPTFKKFLGYENAFMVIRSQQLCANTIEVALRIGNLNPERIKNIEKVYVQEVVKIDLKTLDGVDDIIEQCEYMSNGVVKINIYKIRDQIHSEETIRLVEGCILRLNENNGWNEFILDLNNISILESLINHLVRIKIKLEEMDIKLDIESSNQMTKETISVMSCIDTTRKLKAIDKAKIINKSINSGYVGILSWYRISSSKKVVSKVGKEEPIQSRVAIFDCIKSDKNELKVKFKTFVGTTFKTKNDYCIENNFEEIDKPDIEILEININKLGFSNEFLGTGYYFGAPIQSTEDESVETYINGQTKVKKTIAEYIKEVFEDYEIQHDREALEEDIAETNRRLSNRSKKMM